MNPRIQVMLDSRQLEEQVAEDTEVGGMWAKAVRTLRSSEVTGLDPDSAFTLAYQAALQASTSVVRAAEYRVRGEGHHHTPSPPSPRSASVSSPRQRATST